jgi:hypothetical protein
MPRRRWNIFQLNIGEAPISASDTWGKGKGREGKGHGHNARGGNMYETKYLESRDRRG